MSITNEQRTKIRQKICSDLILQGVTCPDQLIYTAKEIEKFLLLKDQEVVHLEITCLSQDTTSLKEAIQEFLKQKKGEHLALIDSHPRASGSGPSVGASRN